MLFTTLTVGCDKYLTVQPANIIVPQTLDDVKMMVGKYLKSMIDGDIQSYTLYRTGGNWNAPNMYMFEDDFNYENIFFLMYNFYEEGEKQWLSSSWQNSIWNALYTNIGDFNLYIYELERIDDNSIDAHQIEAEVRFARALTYLRLVQFFCPYRANEFAADPERYGLPILEKEEDLQDKFFPVRQSQLYTYNFIISELNKIIELDIEGGDWNLFYNKRALYGLLCELYFWKAWSPAKEEGDLDKVLEYGNKCIDGNNMARNLDELTNMFNPNSASPSPALSFNIVPDYAGSYADVFKSMFSPIYVEQSTYDLFADDDIRRDKWISSNRVLNKWDEADEADYNMTILWRVEEVNLMMAEVHLANGNDSQARALLDAVRNVRMTAPYSYTDTMEELKKERRREFLGEPYCRWKDMKRWGVAITRYTRATNEPLELKANDYKYSFIIPGDGELAQNPNNFQNPGWNIEGK